MHVIARSTLREFWKKHKDAEQPLRSWFSEGSKAGWDTPAEIKDQYRSASVLKNQRVVFDLCGFKYRLVVRINYKYQIVYVRFIGTHKEYDKVNAEEI